MNKKFDLAYENIADFDYIDKCEMRDYFLALQDKLVEVFDSVTTFDVRSARQLSVQIDDCKYFYQCEKDLVIYPLIKLVVVVRDWNYVKNCPCCYRKGEFELKITPFNVSLDKFGEETGVYGGYDMDLTKVWRNFLKRNFPKYEQACRDYCDKVKELKMGKARSEMKDKEERIDKEYYEDIALLEN